MIKFIDVSKLYPPKTYALRNVTFRIKPGEFVSVVGQSGAGKTTLVKLLIAEEKPTSGRIIVGDWDITKIKSSEIPYLRRQIGVVFQDFKLFPHRTVFENIAFVLEVLGQKKKIKKLVPKVLKIVGLAHRAYWFPDQLSVGEKQRVALARAIVGRPKILVADEPTGNIDLINARDILEIFKKINESGTTVLLVTHNREIVNYLRKRVITLDRGRIIADQEKGRYII